MKIFNIGFNKTGTSSVSKLLSMNGFRVAPQEPFQCNLESYFFKNYSTFIGMIKEDYSEYNHFQDVPFSLPFFYKELDKYFPDSKFILTVRDDENQWYNSLVNFHRKIFYNFEKPKKISAYHYEGLIYKYLTKSYNSPSNDPYCEKSLKLSYNNHIDDVKKYFKRREDKLLICNIKDKDLINKLETFLDVKFYYREVPHIRPLT